MSDVLQKMQKTQKNEIILDPAISAITTSEDHSRIRKKNAWKRLAKRPQKVTSNLGPKKLVDPHHL